MNERVNKWTHMSMTWQVYYYKATDNYILNVTKLNI